MTINNKTPQTMMGFELPRLLTTPIDVAPQQLNISST